MLRTGFDRRNLAFAVVPVAGDHGKPPMLMRLLQAPGALPAVVYCGRRRTCEEVTEALVADGIQAASYHAGLTGERRSATLEAFLSGELEAVAATTAFGMGIDKPDVRSVVHWSLPASPEEYYQQAGRAGRDGGPARCTLLYSPRDKGLIVFFINRAKLDGGRPGACTGGWRSGPIRVASSASPSATSPPRSRVPPVASLERAGALELFPAPMGTFAGRIADAKLSRAHLAAALVAGKRVERQRWDRLKAIDGYATSDRCRREALLGYFGDEPARPLPEPCCDHHGWTPIAGEDVSRPMPIARTRPRVAVDIDAAILQAVDETAGAVGRTRLSQILRGSSGKALRAAGHDALASYGALTGMTENDVLDRIDRLIAAGTLEKTDGFYPLVRRPDAGPEAGRSDRPRRRPAGPDRRPGPPPRPRGFPFLVRVLAAASATTSAGWRPSRWVRSATIAPARRSSPRSTIRPTRCAAPPPPRSTPSAPRPDLKSLQAGAGMVGCWSGHRAGCEPKRSSRSARFWLASSTS